MSRDIKYIGMDVHKEATVIAVLNGSGKLVMESIVETKASSILQFIHGLRGELHVTWEEGTWASWLYDLLQPQVERVLVCDPRRNALLKEGNKSDKGAATRASCGVGPLREFYRGFAGQRDEAGDGASDLSPKDRGHCFDTLEEGGTFRRRTTEAASSLSVCTERRWSSQVSRLGGDPSVLAMLGFEGEYPCHSLGARVLPSAPSLRVNPMPPRITRKSDRPRASR